MSVTAASEDGVIVIAFTICGGNAGPNDYHLAARVICIDDEIVKWLERRERRRRRERKQDAACAD
jgi:hypothetical protein